MKNFTYGFLLSALTIFVLLVFVKYAENDIDLTSDERLVDNSEAEMRNPVYGYSLSPGFKFHVLEHMVIELISFNHFDFNGGFEDHQERRNNFFEIFARDSFAYFIYAYNFNQPRSERVESILKSAAPELGGFDDFKRIITNFFTTYDDEGLFIEFSMLIWRIDESENFVIDNEEEFMVLLIDYFTFLGLNR